MAIPTTSVPSALNEAEAAALASDALRVFSEPVYRSVFNMTFKTAPGGRVVLRDGVRIRASYAPGDYNVRTGAGIGGPAQVFGKSGAVFVDQRVPRSVRRITVRSGAETVAQKLKLFRLDADKLAEEPTVEINAGTNLPTSIDAEFRDARFAIKADSLTANQIDDIFIRSFPSTPRIGLAPGRGGTIEPAYFAIEGGEFRETKTLDVRDAYHDALQRLLDEQAAAGAGDTIDIRLVLESDAPCTFNLLMNLTPYEITTDTFTLPPAAGSLNKTVLKFTVHHLTTETIEFEVPTDANVSRAIVIAQLGSGGAAATIGAAQRTIPTALNGVEISSSDWLALPLSLVEPLLAQSLAVGVIPTVAGTIIEAQLRSVWRTRPAGQTLATTGFELTGQQRRNWYQAEFTVPALLSSGDAWLLLRAAQGHAILLCDAEPEVVRDGGTADTRVVRGGEPLARLLANTQHSVPGAASPLALRIGDIEITPTSGADSGRLEFDIAASVNNELSSLSGTAAMHNIALEFVSQQPVLVTVYPPALAFDRG